ncbi:unnamed protein product, partial [Mesorhabditis belari]|uniref:dolichol kinase n=1 Tax=Mesorhabditis belari TaxID=2138241 RepID=A0AAF3FH80_9BILA
MSIDYGYLVQIACTATLLFVIFSAALSQNPIFINGLLVVVVAGAMIVYILTLQIAVTELPVYFFEIVFEPSMNRYCLLSFWIMCVLASIAFGIVISLQGHSSTVHRKFFHLTVSLIYLSGIFLDPKFTHLCGWLWVCIFVCFEVLRFHSVPPWGDHLNNFFLVFKDGQDNSVLLTPIFLLIGVFLPLFLSPIEETHQPHLYHLAGVASVGIGDAFAAVIGYNYGSMKWPGRDKTIEGTIAMAVSVFVTLFLSRSYCEPPIASTAWLLISAAILSAIEAFVKNVDNLLLPVVGYFLL